jgi:hypothetical protein
VRGKARQGEARVRMKSTNKTVPENIQKRLLAGTASGGSVANREQYREE